MLDFLRRPGGCPPSTTGGIDFVATLHDVARAAGVSTATVSRALSDPGRLAPSTWLRVQAAIDALGYRPNRAAALLRSGRTGSIGLLVPDLENPYFASITKGVQARAHRSGLTAFVVDTDEDPGREVEMLSLLARQTDGVVLCAPRSLDKEEDLLNENRVVLVNASHRENPGVDVDYAEAMVRAVEHLRALGHQKIAYVGGPASSWADRMRRHGLAQVEERYPGTGILDLGSFAPRVEGGISAADIAAGSGASAVIAFNDLVAIGLMNQLTSRGMEIPDQMSIVGFDDTFVAQLASPPLTTLRVDLAGLGAQAVDLLVQSLARPDPRRGSRSAPHQEPLFPTQLVVRGSTGRAGVR